jgi:tetratricopeptide (TPR) repeat protein
MRPIDRLIEGVRNRSLWQVAGLYAAGAWVGLQVVDVLADAFDLPGRFAAIALALLIVGFPVVMATALLQRRLQRPAGGPDEGTAPGPPGQPEGGSPARRFLTWRNVLGTGVAVFAVWGVIVTAWLLTQDRSSPRETSEAGLSVSPSVIAVFPFSVRGSADYAHLGEGMVNLLGIKLDGAGDLKSVDSRALLSYIGREGEPTGDPERDAEIARRFGAGLFVMGDVVEAGGRLQVTAALYHTADGEVVQTASAEGEDTFALVDDVATQLLAGVEGPGARVRQIAGVTTSSLPAFRAYLEGEAAFRTFDFLPAYEAFARAVELDTLFAMAYYRLSVAAEWLTRPDAARAAAESAYRHASRLSERDRRLLEAFLAWRTGEHAEAERRYRAILGEYPTDVEAWFQLGEVLNHSNPLHGRPMAEARGAFETVLSYEPRDMAALVHLVRLAGFEGRLADLDSLADRFYAVNPESDRHFEVRAMQVVSHGDPDQVDSLLQAYQGQSDLTLSQVAWNALLYTHDRLASERAAGLLTSRDRFTSEVWTVGHAMRAHSFVSRGRMQDAAAEITKIAEYDRVSATELEAFLSVVPLANVDRSTLERLRSNVQSVDPASVLPSGNSSFFFSVMDDRHAIARLYLLGVLSARLGETEATRAYAEEVGAAAVPQQGGTVTTDLAAGLRAHAAVADGRPRAALENLEEIRLDIFYQMPMASPYDGLVLERYTRGVLLQEAGRYEEALGWLAHLGEVGYAELSYVPAATLRQAEIFEALGEPLKAAEQYAEFVEMWRDADPELQPVVEEARANLRRLVPDSETT